MVVGETHHFRNPPHVDSIIPWGNDPSWQLHIFQIRTLLSKWVEIHQIFIVLRIFFKDSLVGGEKHAVYSVDPIGSMGLVYLPTNLP